MKYVFYVLGILLLTLGISFTMQSDLGTSPFDALLVGLSISVGLIVGSWEVIIAFQSLKNVMHLMYKIMTRDALLLNYLIKEALL